MKTIEIKLPCHEKWQNMESCQSGKFCHVCDKTVHDFTKWKTNDVIEFIENNPSSCGRFNAEQLHSPAHNKWASKSKWLGYAAVLVVFIMSACKLSRRTTGMPIVHEGDTLYNCNHRDANTLDYQHKPNINDTTGVKK